MPQKRSIVKHILPETCVRCGVSLGKKKIDAFCSAKCRANTEKMLASEPVGGIKIDGKHTAFSTESFNKATEADIMAIKDFENLILIHTLFNRSDLLGHCLKQDRPRIIDEFKRFGKMGISCNVKNNRAIELRGREFNIVILQLKDKDGELIEDVNINNINVFMLMKAQTMVSGGAYMFPVQETELMNRCLGFLKKD